MNIFPSHIQLSSAESHPFKFLVKICRSAVSILPGGMGDKALELQSKVRENGMGCIFLPHLQYFRGWANNKYHLDSFGIPTYGASKETNLNHCI